MAVRQLRYSKEEFAQRGDEIYESHVKQTVEEDNHVRIVAIDNKVTISSTGPEKGINWGN